MEKNFFIVSIGCWKFYERFPQYFGRNEVVFFLLRWSHLGNSLFFFRKLLLCPAVRRGAGKLIQLVYHSPPLGLLLLRSIPKGHRVIPLYLYNDYIFNYDLSRTFSTTLRRVNSFSIKIFLLLDSHQLQALFIRHIKTFISWSWHNYLTFILFIWSINMETIWRGWQIQMFTVHFNYMSPQRAHL